MVADPKPQVSIRPANCQRAIVEGDTGRPYLFTATFSQFFELERWMLLICLEQRELFVSPVRGLHLVVRNTVARKRSQRDVASALEWLETMMLFVTQGQCDRFIESTRSKVGFHAGVEWMSVLVKPPA